MKDEKILEGFTSKTLENRKSRLPAKLDFIQSATGLFLIIFMVAHTFLVSSILLGEESMYHVTKFFEGYPMLGGSYPIIVSCVAVIVSIVFILHAFVAVRKFPISYRQWKLFRSQMAMLRTREGKPHKDTNKWFYQAVTGFVLFFLVSVHLYIMMSSPQTIGPYQSSNRVFTWMWPLYMILIIVVEAHMLIGFYRLCVKWGWFDGQKPRSRRRTLKGIYVFLHLVMLILGFTTLFAYWKIGHTLGAEGRQLEHYQPGNKSISPFGDVLNKSGN